MRIEEDNNNKSTTYILAVRLRKTVIYTYEYSIVLSKEERRRRILEYKSY